VRVRASDGPIVPNLSLGGGER